MTHTMRVGERYTQSEEQRVTTVRVGNTDVKMSENLWEDTDNKFDTQYMWSITVKLRVSDQCGNKEEVFTSVSDNLRTVKALGFLGYELYSHEGDGVTIWDRPAPDREP